MKISPDDRLKYRRICKFRYRRALREASKRKEREEFILKIDNYLYRAEQRRWGERVKRRIIF